jgi:hypothetical protein
MLTTKGKIEAFIVTLGTMGIFRSLVTYFADGGTLSLDYGIRDTYRPVYYDSFMGLPIPVWVFILVAIAGWVLLNWTAFGRYCTAIGSNEAVARYSAIKVDRIKTWTYVLQGLCVSLATIIYVPRLGSASSSTGVLVGAGGDRGGDHRRNRAQGRLRPYRRHHFGRPHPDDDRKHPQLHGCDLELPEWHHAGPDHHCRRLASAWRLEPEGPVKTLI